MHTSTKATTTMEPVILFLDFDGVLHHFFPVQGESDADNARFCFLPNFEAAVRKSLRPVEIVISSTWRRENSLADLRALFSKDIAEKIIGITPQLGSGNGPGGRLAEINAWLEQNGRTASPWVAIDDYPEVFGPGIALVVCHDCFRERESNLLAEAMADPVAFATAHPVADYSTPRKLWLPG